MSHGEVYYIPLPILIAIAGDSIRAARNLQQRCAQHLGVISGKTRRGCKDARLVTAAWMIRIQTVLA